MVSHNLLQFACMFPLNLGERTGTWDLTHFHLWKQPPFETVSVIAHICNQGRLGFVWEVSSVFLSTAWDLHLLTSSHTLPWNSVMSKVWNKLRCLHWMCMNVALCVFRMHRCQWLPPESLSQTVYCNSSTGVVWHDYPKQWHIIF